MKQKKPHNDRDSPQTTQPHSHRQPPNPKGAGLTKRRHDIKNKENCIQITEPLDINPHSCSSKQFVLSRENLANYSRSSLKDINTTRNPTPQKYIDNKHQKEVEKEIFDRRLSLKCTGNYSQQLDYQKSQRLSMAPLRREAASTMIPQSLLDERESMSSICQNSLFGSDSKSRHTLKKETIITNLMNKLDYEQDLRSIIELKLKNGSNASYCNFNKDKKNQSYITDFTEDQNHSVLVTKLKQCESEIAYFKTVIREMSEKIVQLTEEKKNNANKPDPGRHEHRNRQSSWVENQGVAASQVRGACERCGHIPSALQASGQVSGSSCRPNMLNESTDFLDNLERTLNILDCHKH